MGVERKRKGTPGGYVRLCSVKRWWLLGMERHAGALSLLPFCAVDTFIAYIDKGFQWPYKDRSK